MYRIPKLAMWVFIISFLVISGVAATAISRGNTAQDLLQRSVAVGELLQQRIRALESQPPIILRGCSVPPAPMIQF